MSKCDCCKEEHDNLIEYRGYKMCPACYMSYVNKIKVCENNAKYENEIDQLKQQLDEKDEKIKRFMSMKNREQLIAENEALKDTITIVLAQKRNVVQHKTQLAIQELEKVNGILTDTIIEVTQNEMDLNKFCYLEEISARFYEKMQEQIKELKGQHND